jgi:hypothetical protein
LSWSGVIALTSLAFMTHAPARRAGDKSRLDRQLGRGEPQGLLGERRGTPSISNMTRPGFTRTAQNSVEPLPLPMRTSVGFFDTGMSGKIRIHTRPARFMWRVSARRAASIWRAVTRSGSIALRP